MLSDENCLAIKLTLRALPVYSILPISAFILHKFKFFETPFNFIRFALYLVCVEFFTFFDHYVILHKMKHGKHDVHHRFKKNINVLTSFAFFPIDGLSQGLPILYSSFLFPQPTFIIFGMIVIVGIWTLFIHTDTGIHPPFLLHYKYHLIHHQKNFYNFGLFTQTFDYLCGTLRHPQ